MNILLTNDDGIDCPGILILAEVLKSRTKHSIFILAPDSDRSGVSHGLTILSSPLKLAEKGHQKFCCSGLPADCAITAAIGSKPCKPDLIISGINRGANLGNDIIYSGTCAAARQAVLCGIPGIALSLVDSDGDYLWESAALYTAEHLDEFLSFWREDVFLNINFPNVKYPGALVTGWPAQKNYNDSLKITRNSEGEEYCSLIMGKESVFYEKGSDCDIVSENNVSLSPVCVFPVIRRDLCTTAPDHAAAGKRQIMKKGEAQN